MGTSPAFSFYAKDFLAGTATMTLAERGAYVTLLCYQWDAGSVPGSERERARILGCNAAQERAVWSKLVTKFTRAGGAYQNTRLETERAKQADRRQKLAANGSKGGSQKVANATERLLAKEQQLGGQNPSLSSSSSFSSSDVPSKNDGTPPPRPLISGESNPRTWGKIHGDHVVGFCDWVCLPEFIFAEFARKSGQTDTLDSGSAYVRGWALTVRERWTGPVGDNLKFWRARWDESHPQAATAKQKIRPVAEILAERERKSS